MDTFEKVGIFKTKDPVSFDDIFNKRHITDLVIIEKISNNVRLFVMIDDSECRLFISLCDAFRELSKVNDALLIHFVEFSLY
jgi:hypothetical protein